MRREHDRRLRDVIAVHGGQEVKALGDGFLTVFESAGAAVACAGDVQRAIDRQAHRGPVPLAVRVGIGAGDVAWEGDDVFGTPVVEAQRLCAAAGPGEILVTDAVRLLAGTAVRMRSTTQASCRCRAWTIRCTRGGCAGLSAAPCPSRRPPRSPSMVTCSPGARRRLPLCARPGATRQRAIAAPCS